MSHAGSVGRRPPHPGTRARRLPMPPADGPSGSLCYRNERFPSASQERTNDMPNIGPLELVIILVIALLILGPGKQPDVGAALGKSIREFRKASSDVQEAVNVSVDTSPLPPTPVAPPAAPAPAPAATV